MYIINYQDQKGYTIISATKKYYPVIAYSDVGSFLCKSLITMVPPFY
ncbi:Spi family protease inhibitor [Bacteroides fragilis]